MNQVIFQYGPTPQWPLRFVVVGVVAADQLGDLVDPAAIEYVIQKAANGGLIGGALFGAV